MKTSTYALLDDTVRYYPALLPCLPDMKRATEIMAEAFRAGGKILTCGNGGSAADAQHIVGELMKGFALKRPLDEDEARRMHESGPDGDYLALCLQGALPAFSLVGETALNTAYANDVAPELVFAQQVYGLGRPKDILIGISTSGNSRNVLYAAQTAKFRGMQTIALTGIEGGKLRQLSDCTIAVPAYATWRIQEMHLPVYHSLCLALENEFFIA